MYIYLPREHIAIGQFGRCFNHEGLCQLEMLCNCQGQLLLFVLIMIQPLQPKPNYITIVNFYACSVQYQMS